MKIKTPTGPTLSAKIGSTVLLFTQFAGFAIALAGLAILQDNCNKNESSFNFDVGIFGLGPNPIPISLASASVSSGILSRVSEGSPSAYDCGIQYSWYWWVIFLQFVCILAGGFAAWGPLHGARACIVSFYSIATTLWCIFAYAMIWEVYLYQSWSRNELRNNIWSKGYICGAAGAIIVLVSNFIFLMILGYESTATHVLEEVIVPKGKEMPAVPDPGTSAGPTQATPA